jgi:DNA-binding MarR family transcriptional regulator
MPTTNTNREELLNNLIRRFQVHSNLTVFFHDAIANKLGLNLTDYKCLSVLFKSPEPLTPTDLARIAGMSTSSITGIIDRLEGAGLVERLRDDQDRRKITLHPVQDLSQLVSQHFESLDESTRHLLSLYNDEEITFITEFYDQFISLLENEISSLEHSGSEE